MKANFTPSISGNADIKPLRHYSHKVLPLVYSDALSYYEVLCKHTNTINALIANGEASNEELNNLYEAFGRLEEYVNSANMDIQNVGTVAHYFPSLETGGYSGNSSLMVVGGKCILFDCGPTVNWSAIRDYYTELYNDGVFTNIDAIVISHYHYDHVENLGSLLDLFPHSSCKAFVPMNPRGYLLSNDVTDVLSLRDMVYRELEKRSVPCVEITEDTIVEVAPPLCSIKLINSTPADYAHYSQIGTVYNNYSMCALVQTGNVYAMYPGDIQRDAQIRLMDAHNLPKLDLYCVHHHGIQNDDYTPYLDKIAPNASVVQTNHARGLVSGASSFAMNYFRGATYSCAYGRVVYVSGNDGGEIIEGCELEKQGWYYSYVDLYVDNTYGGSVHNGTEQYPFTDINEAMMFVRNRGNIHYRIYVKATPKKYSYLWVRDNPCSIEFIGVANGDYAKPNVEGVYALSSPSVSISKFTVGGDGYSVHDTATLIYVADGRIDLYSCDLVATNKLDVGLQVSNAYAYCSSCTFGNLKKGVMGYKFGDVVSNNNSFNGCDVCYGNGGLKITIRGEDAVTNCPTWIDGSLTTGVSTAICARKSSSNIQTLVGLNSSSVVSEPFYYQGFGICIANGKSIYKLTTEPLVAEPVAE